jgi:site-specific DNA recombinase
MKRVWCLYRVSSKKQVNIDDDIPMQKNACHEFVNGRKDWRITNELYERGISGWAKKADERDEMNVIREGAIKGDFDVLLVFMYDRLGRREDETPFVVQFLIEQGIEIWSVKEGQSKIEDHSDILVNFIRFWQSSGESKKTSIRVREAKKQLSEQGYFQGGVAPVGYKIIETDQLHWKNKDRHIKELAIDVEESEMIKLIFTLYVDRHMGYRKIVDYLNSNGYRNRDGKIFGVSTIQRILVNPIYIGKKRYEGFNGAEGETQPYNEKLRIIPDDLFNQAEQVRTKRKRKINEQDKSEIPLVGKLMFSGLAYCKYCGAKLSGNYLYRKNKYKGIDDYYKSVIYRYRCPLNKGKFDCNHEQNIWGAKKFDNIIIKQVKEILSQLDLKTFIDSSTSQKKSHINQKERNISNLEKEHLSLQKQLEKLNGEIAKSLVGDSAFTPQQLSGAIEGVGEKIKHTSDKMISLKKEVENERENYSEVNYMANELDNWEAKFDNADDDLKKAMLSRLIDRVHLGKENVEITFNLTLQECLQHAERETSII